MVLEGYGCVLEFIVYCYVFVIGIIDEIGFFEVVVVYWFIIEECYGLGNDFILILV